MTEQTMSVELTESQYLHIQSILKQDKPSKTRLSQDEKQFIIYTLKHFLEDHPYSDEQGLAESIIKKLK
jgi:hypothetical protein